MRRAALILALTASAIATAAGPAAATVRPPVYCDPMACPDPVGGIQECLRTASLTADPNTGLPVIVCSPRDIIYP